MSKTCIVCNTKFTPKSNRAQYCSDQCKKNAYFLNSQKKLKAGGLNIDYVVDMWNGYVTPRIYGKWMAVMHPGKTTADYLSEFPGAPLYCQKDKDATFKNAGLHMKDPTYKKMASDAIKGKQNPNHKSNVNKETRQSRSPFSKKFKKYKSDLNRKEFLESIDWSQRITSNNIEWWLNKGHSVEEAKELLKERQSTFTLEKCITKYGKKEGTKIFNERQDKWKKSLQANFEKEGDGRSPSSKFANSLITDLCSYLGIEIPKKEKWMMCKKTGNAYSYDFTYGKKIIEFNGDYWHCNPCLYEANYFNKNKGLTAKEIQEYDSIKNQLAKNHGYQVLVIWESDWLKTPSKVLNKCKIFLNE